MEVDVTFITDTFCGGAEGTTYIEECTYHYNNNAQ